MAKTHDRTHGRVAYGARIHPAALSPVLAGQDIPTPPVTPPTLRPRPPPVPTPAPDQELAWETEVRAIQRIISYVNTHYHLKI